MTSASHHSSKILYDKDCWEVVFLWCSAEGLSGLPGPSWLVHRSSHHRVSWKNQAMFVWAALGQLCSLFQGAPWMSDNSFVAGSQPSSLSLGTSNDCKVPWSSHPNLQAFSCWGSLGLQELISLIPSTQGLALISSSCHSQWEEKRGAQPGEGDGFHSYLGCKRNYNLTFCFIFCFFFYLSP